MAPQAAPTSVKNSRASRMPRIGTCPMRVTAARSTKASGLRFSPHAKGSVTVPRMATITVRMWMATRRPAGLQLDADVGDPPLVRHRSGEVSLDQAPGRTVASAATVMRLTRPDRAGGLLTHLRSMVQRVTGASGSPGSASSTSCEPRRRESARVGARLRGGIRVLTLPRDPIQWRRAPLLQVDGKPITTGGVLPRSRSRPQSLWHGKRHVGERGAPSPSST